MDKRDELLRLLQNNSRIDLKDAAVMLGEDEVTIANEISEMEKDGTICGYYTLINWDNTDETMVDALIEVNVNTVRDQGFDVIAERIYQFDEVKSCYLISGRYDFLLILEGKTMHQVANFVSSKLSTLEGVTSTATHFIMKRYKDFGTVLGRIKEDYREKISI